VPVETSLLLFQNIQVLSVTLGKSDGGLLVADDENVGFSGGKGLALGVFQVDDVEATQVLFDVLDGGDSADVVSTGDVGEVAGLVGVPLDDLVLLKVEPESVTFVDFGVREPDGSSVVGNDVGGLVGTHEFALDLHKLDLGFGVLDLDGFESSLNVVEHSIVFVGLGDADDVHDANGELVVPSDFVIDLDTVLLVLANEGDFTAGDGVVKVVSAWMGMYLRTMLRGRHSLSLWGPWLGLVA
jgi:hypothetical protein